MKCVLLLLAVGLIFIHAYPQGVFNNSTTSTLQKVIEDYPNSFRQIKGENISNECKASSYSSKVQMPGASNCVIIEYKGGKKEVYAWKCDLVEAGDFNRVRDQFKNFYGSIKNSIIKIEGQQPFILNGKYESPAADKDFTSVIFELLPSSGELQKLKVELRIQRRMNKWRIVLSVYEQEINDYARHTEADN